MPVEAGTRSADGQRLAWAWASHLRRGGTTPWERWRTGDDRPTEGVEDRGPYLPGAQQLELLRRLNEAARTVAPHGVVPTPGLAERVLATSAPGRGIPDLELVGAARDTPFGARPVDPATLPDAELVRVATGLLAEDLVAAGEGAWPAQAPPALARPWRRRYRLVGDPWLADPPRAELVRRGRPPGGKGSVVLVVGTDLATMLAHAWTLRSLGDGAPAWRDWLDPLVRAGRVPRPVDLAAQAAVWAERVGTERVRVVLDPSRLPELTGVRRPLPGAPALGADAVELTRRVGAAVGLLVLPDRRADLLRHTWAPRLAAVPGAEAPPLRIPVRHLAAVERRAVRMREQVLAAGYAVVGDPDALVPRAATEREPDGPDGPDENGPSDPRVLALALRLLLDPDVKTDLDEEE